MVICFPIPLAPLAPLKHMYLLKALTWGVPRVEVVKRWRESLLLAPKKNAKRVQKWRETPTNEETGLHSLLHSVARVVVRLLVTVNTHRVVLEGLLLLEQVVYSIDLKVNPKRRIAGVGPPTRYI
jgi:hypothetical protein